MTRKEKGYVIVVVLLIAVLCVKSFMLDAYKPKDDQEASAIVGVEKILADMNDSWVYDYNILYTRIVALKALAEDDPAIVKYMEQQNIDAFDVEGRYKVKVRKYLFGVLPIGEETVINIMENENE